jgi:hypothetical protein
MSSRLRSGKKKKRQDDDDDDIVEEDERVLFFIPSAGIDIEVLVFYLKRFLGHDSDAQPGRHPQVRLSMTSGILLMRYRIAISMAILLNLDSA